MDFYQIFYCPTCQNIAEDTSYYIEKSPAPVLNKSNLNRIDINELTIQEFNIHTCAYSTQRARGPLRLYFHTIIKEEKTITIQM